MNDNIAGVTATGETVTPQQALDKLAGLVQQTKNYPKSELFEKLAAIEHERWADWQRYVHSKCMPSADDGIWQIGENFIKHWEKEIATPYSELSEAQKNSDRDQVLRYWKLINP